MSEFKAGVQVAHRTSGGTVNTGTVSMVLADGSVCVTWHRAAGSLPRLRCSYSAAAAAVFLYAASAAAVSANTV